jgi:hypothetical protein
MRKLARVHDALTPAARARQRITSALRARQAAEMTAYSALVNQLAESEQGAAYGATSAGDCAHWLRPRILSGKYDRETVEALQSAATDTEWAVLLDDPRTSAAVNAILEA